MIEFILAGIGVYTLVVIAMFVIEAVFKSIIKRIKRKPQTDQEEREFGEVKRMLERRD